MRNKLAQSDIEKMEMDLIGHGLEYLSSMGGSTATLDLEKVQAELDMAEYNIRKTEKDRVDKINKLIQKQMKEIDLKGRTIKEVRDDGSSLTVEFETGKWNPKAGDVCESGDGAIFIYKSASEPTRACFYAALYEDKFYISEYVKDKGFRPATRDERCKFFERLTKEGYKWNAKKLELTKVEKWEPKDGEFVHSSWDNGKQHGVGILRGEYKKGGELQCYCLMSTDGGFMYGAGCEIGTFTTRIDRPASEMDKRWLIEAIKENGLQWNAEKKRVEKLRWRAKEGEQYETIVTHIRGAHVQLTTDHRGEYDNWCFESGNYYNPATNDAITDANRINAIFNENK